MKATQLFTKTQKTVPADEKAKNAQLLIKAGFIHKEMSGVYAFLPLGVKVIEKIKNIVRQEMNAIGGQEVVMTTLQPKEIWQKTDRWDDAKVDNWFKTKLVNGTELGVGLTHEEPIVDVVGQYLRSYKDLPFSVYQIQSKFRNELRAKSGLLRGREFLMKDMYSFSKNQAQHEQVYEEIAGAYTKVYQRLGLGDITFRAKADGGIFTEKYSDEYQTLSDAGEDTLFCIPEDNVYYNQEVAPSKAPDIKDDASPATMQEVEGVGIVGVQDLAKFLNIPVEKTTKTMLYQTDDGRIIAAAVRGGYNINEIKLRKALKAKEVHLATPEIVKKVTKAEVGYAGLLNLPADVQVIIDESCLNRVNFEMGANKTNCHNINVNWGQDLPEPKQVYDIKTAIPGDFHPDSGKLYTIKKAVEVGNIFPLETKYTDLLDVYYTDEAGKQQSIVMGCYGIGVSRLMGVLAEHFSDDKGLIWPKAVTPFMVYLAQIGTDDSVTKTTQELYDIMQANGVEVFWDNRGVRPGEKFADADLYGFPYRVVVSKKTIEQNAYEVKERTQDQAQMMSKEDLIKLVTNKDLLQLFTN